MQGPDGTTRVEPSEGRILTIRVMGVVVAVVALAMGFGGPSLLF